MSLAVIKTGGKNYLVKIGDKVKIEKINGQAGETVNFDTLLITDEKGEKIEVGKPLLQTKVSAKIIKQDRADKIMVTKFKNKVRYRRRVGHHQPYTLVQIDKI